MNEDYLWNRAGKPDAEITELEHLLGPLAYRPNAETLQAVTEQNVRPRRSRYWLWAGAAAAMLAGIGLSFRHRILYTPRESAWELSWNGATPHPARIGQTIETGRSAARLESEFIGEVRVDPSSRLQILRDTKDEQRLALEHGTIH